MKHTLLRRLSALALAWVLALSMAVTPAMAANPTSIRIMLDGKVVTGTTITVKEQELIKLECVDQSGNPANVVWSKDGTGVTINQSGGVRGKTPGTTTTIIATVVDENGGEVTAACSVTVEGPVPVTGVTLSQTELLLIKGETAVLTATVIPADADDKTVKWSSDNESVATVKDGLVTAIDAGSAGSRASATITATAVDKNGDPIIGADGKEITATCKVSVGIRPRWFSILNLRQNPVPSGDLLDLGLTEDSAPKRLTIVPDPTEAIFTYDSVKWEVLDPKTGQPDQSVIRVVKDPASIDKTGCSAVATVVGPGTAKLVVTSGDTEGRWDLTVSGITLQGDIRTIQDGKLTLREGDVETLLVNRFGSARTATGNIIWYSSNDSIVSVNNSGKLTARAPGTVKVTAGLVGYADAEVTVTVQEDVSGLIQVGQQITAGSSVNLATASATVRDPETNQVKFSGTISSVLNSIAQYNTGSGLSYINNLSVATSQGILHDNHRSEADTGAGVGSMDRYYLHGNTALGQTPLSDLSFVAKNTFSGTADISYTGCTVDNQFFSGTIRVTVGAANDVFYTAVAGQPLSFQADDFNRICQSKQGGRSLNYITFTLPQASWGELRYDYNGPTHPGQAVTSGTQYYRTRTPSLDRVSFIPSSTCPSSVAIAYRGMDANGGTYSGVVTISVTKQNGGNSLSDVHFSGLREGRVAFNASAFNLACYNTIGEQLSYVRFGSLPAASEGTLYVNYWAAGSYGGIASPNTSYYASGAPGLSTLSFVSSSTAPSQVAIPYTGYGARGTVYTGMVYIDLDEANRTGLRYSVSSGKTVSFNVNDFNNACINATGASLNYVRFSTAPTTAQGYLRYRYMTGSNYGTVSTSTQCYRVNPNSSSSTVLIGNVYFQANTGYVGTVTLPYTGYNTNGVSFTGEVVIQVTPNTITYTGTNANPLQVSASDLSSACSGLTRNPLSYITLNNLPSTSAGRLYVGYTKLGTGTPANTGTRYYVSSSPSISQLSFVPRGRYTGQVEVGYTAVSTSGEQVTGRIVFNIVAATGSSYFRDMGNYVWAASAVDYLNRNGVVNGIGNNRFGPNQYILRRDFILMLSRGFSFPAAGTYSFPDVPMNSYYASAVASAKYLGIVRGSGGYFLPASAITREDAMVMVYNTLIKMGKNPGSGGTALLTQFSDYQLVSSYARDAVGALVQMGAVTGSNGRLNPKAPITRAEAAVILHFVLTM
ncbi:MAG: S-layer homology domain-containing protein [Oscillospiraceae bacterium]|nr:S-layer homology domain-containing protein [Oscillospiraceae bacterium]